MIFSEVNFNTKMPVQIMYRQNLYNGKVLYINDTLVLEIENDVKNYPPLIFTVNKTNCIFEYNNMKRSFKRGNGNPDNPGTILYDYISRSNGVIKLNEQTNEYKFNKVSVNDNIVTLKEYEKENKAFYIEIT